MVVSVTDVEALSSKGWQHLEQSKKEALLDDAKTERNTLYSDRVSTLPTLEGDENVFIKNLAAHKYEQAEGGESQSESQTGGSVSYNTVTGEVFEELSETRYGRVALKHLRDNQSIGVITTF